ncbi:MAG: hypothetical protein EOP51_07665 [Sphingobacteriales bacterium]|nr:MAG: hypothetical protein EOP51_07665 [Sphingobacteriales bacterium]
MLKRVAHIVLSVWLSIILLFGSTSKEFVHLFSGHEDTVHCTNGKTGLVFESQHHHCTFLSFCLTAFVNDGGVSFTPLQHTVAFSKPYTFYTSAVFAVTSASPTLRGPPAV